MNKVLTILFAASMANGCSFDLHEPSSVLPGYERLAVHEVPADTLVSAGGSVLSVDFHPWNNRLITLRSEGSRSSTLSVWFADTGLLEHTFPNPDFLDLDVCFSNDGSSIGIGSYSPVVIRSDDFRLRRAFTAHTYMDERLLGLDMETAWPFAIREVVFQKKYHFVTSVAFSPDDRFILSGHDNNLVRAWELKTGSLLNTLEMSSIYGRVTGVRFSPDGRFIAAVQNRGRVRVWGFPDYREIVLDDAGAALNAIAFDPFTGFLAAGTDEGAIVIWDLEDGRMVRRFRVHLEGVLSVEFSRDGLHMASCGEDRMVAVSDVSTGQPLVFLGGHSGAVNDISFNPNSSLLASGSADGMVLVWDISMLSLGRETSPVPEPVYPPRLSCVAEYVDASGDGTLSEGENSVLRLSLTNHGQGAAYRVVSMILPDSIDTVVETGRVPIIPLILPGRTVTVETGVTLSSEPDSDRVSYHLRVYESNGFHLERPLPFSIPVRR